MVIIVIEKNQTEGDKHCFHLYIESKNKINEQIQQNRSKLTENKLTPEEKGLKREAKYMKGIKKYKLPSIK